MTLETAVDSSGGSKEMFDGIAMKAERTRDRVDKDRKRSSNSITPVIFQGIEGEDSFTDTTKAGRIVASQIPKFYDHHRNCWNRGDEAVEAGLFERSSTSCRGRAIAAGPNRVPSPASGCLVLSDRLGSRGTRTRPDTELPGARMVSGLVDAGFDRIAG